MVIWGGGTGHWSLCAVAANLASTVGVLLICTNPGSTVPADGC